MSYGYGNAASGPNAFPNGNTHYVNGSGPPSPPMTEPNEATSFLEASGEHAEILKVLDELRDLGIGQGRSVHSLPQIIVCGSQSSGKSSVLEAIAGIPFPRKSQLCTKYKTRVTILRKSEVGATLKIIPDSSRPTAEAELLRNFVKELESTDWRQSMPPAISEADNMIFSGTRANKTWTNDTLSITITDPHKQDLELLDLPGLIKVDKHNEGAIDMVERMVTDEMKKPHSIVLAVARATDDLEHHEILQMCKDLKVDSRRTLGVLTMPDLADTRADTYASIVQGQDKQFKDSFPLDWHVLLNGSDKDLADPMFDRDRKEREFFIDQRPWNQLRPKDKGIDELRRRLSSLLFTVAQKELPNLFQSMREREKILKEEMDNLGGDLDEKDLKRAFKKSLDRLKQKAKDHARGIYESDIRNYPGSHPVHLRSRVVEQNEVFRDRLLKIGHEWDLEGRIPTIDPDADLQSVHRPPTTRDRHVTVKVEDKAVQEFRELLDSMRSRGLPGFNNEEVVNKAFWLLTERWKGIAEDHIKEVFQCCESYFDTMTSIYFAKPETTTSLGAVEGFGNCKVVARRFRRKYLTPALEEKKREAFHELTKLGEDRLDICHNFDREFLRKFRLQREKRHMKRAMDLLHNSGDLDKKPEVEPADIGKLLNLHTQEDWTTETAKDLLSAVWTHYEVSIQHPE